MAASTIAASPGILLEHRPWWRSRTTIVAAIVGVMVICHLTLSRTQSWPDSLVWHSLNHYLDNMQNWLAAEGAKTHPNFAYRLIHWISSGLDALVRWLYHLLSKWLTWPGTTLLGGLLAWRFGGRRAGVIMVASFASFAALGLWDDSMQTLSLMLVAVALSLLVGVPLGIVAGRSDRFERLITPVLDAAQIIPAFAYLMPVVIFFSVGPAAAVITTMVYSVPPAVRITALGIRSVPANTVEAALALGSTQRQLLWKVQLPLARRLLLLSVNQTILFALSMVVIAGLINTEGGLGAPVTNGLNSDPALAILAGAAIVVMAIALDRVTEAIAERTDPAKRHLDVEGRKRARLATGAVLGSVAVAAVLGHLLSAGSAFTRWTAQDWLRTQVQSVLDYVQKPSTFLFNDITNPLGNFVVAHLLQPLDTFLVETPWFITLAGLTAIAFVLSGLRPAVTTTLMFALIGAIGEWQDAMDTFSQVLVATAIAVVIGIVLGVLAAEIPWVSRAIRPVNDVLQTLPQLVYVIPFVYIFPISYVPGLIASVLYAFPVVVRLVERGVRDVAPETVEAAGAFGATRLQTLVKVKIPLARDAIMLGINQGIIMVLAVVVIAGLVGSGALGYAVAAGLQRGQFGIGVVASIAILAMGIALDRVTRGNRSAAKGGRS
ncbi:MAG TPA: ABC transporter permease subunit [Gaiellaceae bacterium]|nr:ABC transporter permease subunit [Gaiellaceae bacterium]